MSFAKRSQNWLFPVLDIGSQVIQKALGLLSSPGIRVTKLEVDIQPHDGGYQLRVLYRFAMYEQGRATPGRRLILDQYDSPMD
jgi:hypothetical protein